MAAITPQLLLDATGCSPVAAGLYAEPLAEACEVYGINTHVRLAAFLAQIGHESGSLRYVRELADGSAYEGRKSLGNTEPGDGQRYKGRGLIQCTGRANYARMRDVLRKHWPDAPDFEAVPHALEYPEWAARSAAAWWATNGCNEIADRGDFVALTKRINGGLNGIDDRRRRWGLAKQVLGESPAKENPMAPIIAAILPAIIEAIPKLGKVFGSGSEVAERNIRAAELVVETVKQATGAVNAQDAAEKIAADPQARAAADKAIDAIWYELTEVGGGIESARKHAEAYADPAGPKFWLNPAFWISIILLALPVMLLVDVFYVHPGSYTGELRTQIVTGVLMVISIVGGFWLGTSFSSQRKTDILAGK